MLSYNKYLSFCDIVYANKSKSSYSITNLHSLDLNLSTKEFKTEIKSYATVELSDIETQSNLFLFLYITFFFVPFITLKNNLDENYLIRTGLAGKAVVKSLFNFFNKILFLLNTFFFNLILNASLDKKFFISLNVLNFHYIIYYVKTLLFTANLKYLTLCCTFKTKS